MLFTESPKPLSAAACADQNGGPRACAAGCGHARGDHCLLARQHRDGRVKARKEDGNQVLRQAEPDTAQAL
jgi:hypothetical protein